MMGKGQWKHSGFWNRGGRIHSKPDVAHGDANKPVADAGGLRVEDQRVVDPAVLDMVLLRAFCQRRRTDVFAGGKDGHAEGEGRGKTLLRLQMEGMMQMGEKGVVAKQVLTQAIFDVEADDGAEECLQGLAADNQLHHLAADAPAERECVEAGRSGASDGR